jgi:methylaspartate mutase epsilon subunit
LAILRRALIADGYSVQSLGTQNKLEDFARLASVYDVVMISSLDGHARYYLREFPEVIKRYQAYGPLWYLGGNLDIGDGVGCEREFLEMGMSRVFVNFVDATTVLETLRRDLAQVETTPQSESIREDMQVPPRHLPRPVADVVMEPGDFARARREVLDHWKTGRGAADLENNARFIARQPSFFELQQAVHTGRAPAIIQPRSGVPLVDQQIRLFKTFKECGVRALSYQVDSLTRNNNYSACIEAIRQSKATGVPTINGFPVVNHGVFELRKIANEARVPLQTRHSTRDPRLLAEISYGGGVTSYEGGAICYNIPYYKDYPLDESITLWQYVDRLTGLYYDRYGIVLDREFFGTLTATLIPPSMAIVVNLLEAILAVRQGVKSVSLGYAEQGHRIQDIAAIRVMRQMVRESLDHLGYKNVSISAVFQQYMSAFPSDRARAADLIYNSAVTAALSGATRVITKTPVEAIRIPTIQDNLEGISLVNQGSCQAQKVPIDEARIKEECDIIRKETQAMLESVVLSGNGDLAQGVVSAFSKGYLDIPFSPSRYNRGDVMGARDVEGAVRYLNLGNLQFDKELRQFHQEKMQERRRAESSVSAAQDYLLIEKDVLRIPRGEYEKWPLFP